MTENFENTDEIIVLKNNPIIFVQETLSVLYFLKPFLLSKKEWSFFVIGKQVNISRSDEILILRKKRVFGKE